MLVILIRPVSVFSGKDQHCHLTVLFFFFLQGMGYKANIYAVSILNDAFRQHHNTLTRKTGCICW